MIEKQYNLPKDKRIRIGAYGPLTRCTEEEVQKLAESGVDFAILRSYDIPKDKRTEVFEWLAKYGIEAVVSDKPVMKEYERAELLDLEKSDEEIWFMNEPMCTYANYVDEPGTEHFEVLGNEVRNFMKRFPGKKVYINLLPMYANSAQLTGGAWKAKIEYYEQPSTDYRQYIDEYVRLVPTDYICADIYPCKAEPDPDNPEVFPAVHIKTIYRDYIKNVELLADACRKSGRDMWCCIQTCAWSCNVSEPSEAELRWQAYTMLSFGAKALMYYTFSDRTNHTGALLNVRGDKTKLFFASKRMCEGLKKLSDLYVTYKNIGAFNVNSSPEKTPYLEMYKPYTDFSTISEIECNTPLLVGCFEKTEGTGKAFTLVNMKDFQKPEDANIKIKVNGNITVYRDGNPEKMISSDGWYEISLVQGDGVFVTVE